MLHMSKVCRLLAATEVKDIPDLWSVIFRSRRDSKGQPGQAKIDMAGLMANTETELVLNGVQIKANSRNGRFQN